MYASTAEQRSRERVQALAEKLYRERYPYLLRIATKNAANPDDAAEAVNEAFASFIRAYDPDGPAPALPWLVLTIKRDCWARYRGQHLGRRTGQEGGPDSEGRSFSAESILSGDTGPEQLVERIEEARTQLAELKPAERRALSLIAAGYSYREVGQITGFSYTKTNRCAAEGRAALRRGWRVE